APLAMPDCLKRKMNLFPTKIVAIISAVIISIATAAPTAGEMHPFVRAQHGLLMDPRDGAEAADTNGVTWKAGGWDRLPPILRRSSSAVRKRLLALRHAGSFVLIPVAGCSSRNRS